MHSDNSLLIVCSYFLQLLFFCYKSDNVKGTCVGALSAKGPYTTKGRIVPARPRFAINSRAASFAYSCLASLSNNHPAVNDFFFTIRAFDVYCANIRE